MKRAARRLLGERGRSALQGKQPPSPVMARYAALLDGEHLWLAVDAGEDPIGLARADGVPIEVTDDLPAGCAAPTPGVRASRWFLPPIVDTEGYGEFPLVAVGPGGRRPVHTADLGRAAGATTPVTGDGRHQFRLVVADDGALSLRVAATREAPTLLAMGYADGTARLRCSYSGDGEAQLCLASDVGALVVRLQTERGDGVLSAAIGPDDLPAEPGSYPVSVVDGDRILAVMRAHNGLEDTSEVLLPIFPGPSGPAARLRFRKGGRLVLRRLAERDGA